MYAKEYFHPFNPTPLQSKPIIIVGPSGVGKRTLVTSVLEKYGDLFERKKSVTTRNLRTGEDPDNCNFKFVSMEEFNKMVAEKKFIEYKEKL